MSEDAPTPMRDLQGEYELTSDERGVPTVQYTPRLPIHIIAADEPPPDVVSRLMDINAKIDARNADIRGHVASRLPVTPVGQGEVIQGADWQEPVNEGTPLAEFRGVPEIVTEIGAVPVMQGQMFRTEGGMVRVGKGMRKRDPRDFYPTEMRLCRAALEVIPVDAVAPIPWVLDPGAGAGPWGVAVRERWPQAMLTGIELDKRHKPHPAYGSWGTVDFLSWESGVRYDMVIGNPPYSMAEQFVTKAASLLAPWGHILFLLRLGFLASQGRARGLFKYYPPDAVYVCATRPSFLGENSRKTDATEYALFHWHGNGRDEGRQRDEPRVFFWDWAQPECVGVTQDRMPFYVSVGGSASHE